MWQRLRTIGFVALLILAAGAPAEALGPVRSDVPVLRKLGRGLSNTVLSIAEVPFRMGSVGRHEGPFAGVTLGLLSGVGNALVRTAAGVIEVMTFPLPLPRRDYAPLVEPEFLFQPDSAWMDEWRVMDGSY
jgi:putative exosortase-associated protein (TIGR04073 family)